MPPNLGGFFMIRAYYPSECQADYVDFERIEALKPAIEACGISTLSQSPMLGFHKQMDNRIKLLEEILSFFFSSRRRHTRCLSDWSSDVCSSDLDAILGVVLLMEPERVLRGELARKRCGGISSKVSRRSSSQTTCLDIRTCWVSTIASPSSVWTRSW